MRRTRKPNDVYLDYRDGETLCELAFEFGLEWGRDGKMMRWPSRCIEINAAGTHHIWSKCRRPDLISNFISLAAKPHWLFHFGTKGEQVPLRLLCMAAKAKKAERLRDSLEFSIAETDEAAGCSVRGWVESATLEPAWGWVEEFRAELLERLA